MYLSKLELHGFKSFAERTVLQFDPGITAIVGPNGCGKSNIVDAVRWVIGEQRARVLRSEKMENVIFNGTSRRRPLGMAEVLLTVENTRGVLPTEYSEVTLGRRLFRSGDSDYLLNNTACRLKDITDLFMDTGMGAGAYSVIELKMVEEILSENAQDRRRLFEEAAGITRYKLRRKQTLGKLDSTQVDLNRVRDLTEEVDKQVRSLKRQAEKANRYREHADRLRRLELALAQLEFDRLTERLVHLDTSLESIKGEISTLEATERGLDAELSDHRARLELREAELAAAREALNEQVAAERSLEAEQRLILERLDAAHRERERLRAEADADAARVESLETDAARLTEAIEAAEPDVRAAEEALEQARRGRQETQNALTSSRATLDASRRTERTLEEKRITEQRRIDRQSARREFLQSEHARLTAERERVESEIEAIKARATSANSHFEERRALAEQAREQLRAVSEIESGLRAEMESQRQAFRQLEKSREGAAAEAQVLENLVASFEEFPDAVRFLAESAGDSVTEITTVADVLDCGTDLRAALDAALGAFAACIIVERIEDVRAAAARLDAGQRGRASFIVLDRLGVIAPMMRPTPNARPLLDAIRVSDARFEPVARMLIGDVLVTEVRPADFDTAALSPGARVVTVDGEWLTSSGIVHTGSRRHVPSALTGRIERRQQLERVMATLASLDVEIAAQQGRILDVEQRLAELPLEERREAVADAERELAEAEKEEARAAYEAETAGRRLTEHRLRAQSVDEELQSLDSALRDEQESLAILEREAAHAQDVRLKHETSFRNAEEAAAGASSTFNDANVAAIQGRNRLHNIRLDLDRADEALRALADREAARQRQKADLQERVSIWQRDLDALREKAAITAEGHRPAEERVSRAEAEVETFKRTISGDDERLRALRMDRESRIRHENAHAVQRAEVQTRLQDLVQGIAEDMDVRLGEDAIDTAEVDETFARSEVHDLRQKIRNLGAVNELALESYEEEKERLDFLVEQQRDLESAEKTLLETIKEINTTASERFLETYEAIHASFRRIFVDLFGEDASAELTLVEPENPLESAIEITAKPRGKRPSTIAQLSGGEKTLTAIALLFAIYLVKPSPFCILDEVDAPLDDANVERFMNLIRGFAKETQFILVTHNKRTMEAADRLYGITMQEQGVSKLVGVRFDEAVEMVG